MKSGLFRIPSSFNEYYQLVEKSKNTMCAISTCVLYTRTLLRTFTERR